MKRFEGERPIYEVLGGLNELRDSDGEPCGMRGAVRCREGVIDVTAYNDKNGGQYVYYATVIDGTEYWLEEHRTARDRVSERGAKIVANRWIKAVLAGEYMPGSEAR